MSYVIALTMLDLTDLLKSNSIQRDTRNLK